ncbi:MAG: glycosyltransferase family 4 protein [Alphaproteobacteria bacterium]|nr:glycosyltransferase family 4 protein [Alphaproteobacteria bacterium]
MSLKVLALAWYARDGASSRVRMMQYVPHLERRGISVEVQSLLPEDYVSRLYRNGRRPFGAIARACAHRLAALVRGRDCDVIWLQRELIPYLPFGIEKLLLPGRPVVVDNDDAHHLYYKRSSNPLVRDLLANKIERLMSLADAVCVGSPAMAEVARAGGAKRVELIHSAVDTHAFTMNQPAQFTVGWIGSPMTAEESLPMVVPPLQRFLAETNSKCILVGVKPDQFAALPAERLAWNEAGEAGALARLSVGLCPLPDTPWHRGKSGYKIIQYMAAGKPALVSPVGIAADLTVPGETGSHCRTDDEWYAALMTLFRDANLRAEQGRRAREVAVARFDTAVVAENLARIFQECSPKR